MAKILSLPQAFSLAFRLHMMPNDHAENYEQWVARWFPQNVVRGGGGETYLRETYDLWRRDIIKQEVRKEMVMLRTEETGRILGLFLAKWPRRIHILTIVLLILAVAFPPTFIYAGRDVVNLGLTYAFDKHLGQIDSMFLACELVGIVALSWFAQRLVKQ